MKTISNLQFIALIACAIMAVSCFLPWSEVSSSADIMGMSASYSQKISGMKMGTGIIVLFISAIAAILTFLRPQLVTIPGILNLLVSSYYLVGIEKSTYSISTGYGHANAGAGIGLYILMIASIGVATIGFIILKRPVIVTVKKEEPVNPTEITSTSSEPVQLPISKQALNPETKKMIFKGTKLVIMIVGIIAIAIVGSILYSEFDRVKKHAIDAEKSRIDEIRTSIKTALETKDYNQAFTLINSFHWDLNPADNPDFVKIYDEERNGLQLMVNKMKHEDDSLKNVNRLIEQTKSQQAQEQWDRDNILAHTAMNFPFTAMVSSPKCFIYSEPNINSERKAELVQETDLNILSAQNEFYYCNYKTSDGKVESGWIYYNDMAR